jgi:hypothetical protein
MTPPPVPPPAVQDLAAIRAFVREMERRDSRHG